MKKLVYIVTAYRWGDRENHSYNLGVFTKKSKAIKYADDHANYRGGKYAGVVEECQLDHFNNEDDRHTKEIYRSKSVKD